MEWIFPEMSLQVFVCDSENYIDFQGELFLAKKLMWVT